MLNSIQVAVILIISAAALFLISSIVVSAILALWVRVDLFGNAVWFEKKRMKALTCVMMILAGLIFGNLSAAFPMLKKFDFVPSAGIANHDPSAESYAFAAVLASIDFRLLRPLQDR